ncbi:DsrE family protein [Thiococcus pfennigii]|jgi:intracellular sulfur oxidation DsrE/DsrF family protein|uniref:DsrE family protein n=1 Tax=Thiococcus pfennigii TaxID=1057 RepID=UPI001906136A|nr:DsrE family protein [Thiococcus pfennigii]MBK1732544.1 hypothetical protein [Thiococcus pfennigii]
MIHPYGRIFTALIVVALTAMPSLAGDYGNALKGVTKFDAVFDFTHGDPEDANVILTAIDQVDDGPEVAAMPNAPRLAIVFHDAAVHLLSTEQGSHDDAAWGEVQKFQKALKDMKEKGVTMEVCQFALDVFGIDRSTIIPEIDQVPNGFVSVIGYQAQGYALVRIP